MADIIGSSFVLRALVVTGVDLVIDGPVEPATAVINGTTFLYVPSDDDDLVQVFTVASDGSLTFLGDVTDTAVTTLNGAQATTTFSVGGNQFLAVTGFQDDGVTVFALSDTAPFLTLADAVFDVENTDFELDGPLTISSYTLGGNTFLVVGGFSDDGLSVFQVGTDGSLTFTASVEDSDNPNFAFNGPYISDVFFRFSTPFIAVGAEVESGLTIFRLDDTGGLTFTNSLQLDRSVFNPLQAAAYQSGSNVFLFSSSTSNDEVYLTKFNGSSLELIQTIESSLLDRVVKSEVIELGDKVLFVASSYSSEGFQVFEFDPILQRLEYVTGVQSGELGSALGRTQFGKPFEIDGKLFVAVSGETSNAINIFEIGAGDDVLEGTRELDVIEGRDGDDFIWGYEGPDQIDGGEGADIIFAGSGHDAIFVSPEDDDINGGSGRDQLDATFLPSALQGITIDLTKNEVRLGDGETVQRIFSIEDARGTDEADTLIGSEKRNTLEGLGGADDISGGGKADILLGGDGADTLRGQDGDDGIVGDAGRDVLIGGSGKDSLNGRLGNDLLEGGSGADNLNGQEGKDTLIGGNGADDLFGESEDDELRGGSGADTLNGGLGRDTMTGGAGADVFEFLSPAESSPGANRDVITDFEDGKDKIDLSDLFEGSLTFIGSAAFSGSGPEVRAVVNGSGNTIVRIDVDGDGSEDARIELQNFNAPSVDDFIL